MEFQATCWQFLASSHRLSKQRVKTNAHYSNIGFKVLWSKSFIILIPPVFLKIKRLTKGVIYGLRLIRWLKSLTTRTVTLQWLDIQSEDTSFMTSSLKEAYVLQAMYIRCMATTLTQTCAGVSLHQSQAVHRVCQASKHQQYICIPT